jgi:glucose-1-phosphate cytidylyltransferase
MTLPERPPVAVLCGGRGTRLQERTEAIPKPLVEIGGSPILWHVIQIYASQGFRRFILCLGYKGHQIEHFAAETPWPAGVEIQCIDTGLDTPTGGRLKLLEGQLDGQTFCATYADGVADVDLSRLVDFHRSHAALASITVVRPELQFGVAQLDGEDRVAGFQEKPRLDHWINGGFFVFEPGAFGYLSESSVLEREALEGLAADDELRAFRHTGFWDCMDTYKDAIVLNDLWATGQAPWKLWE